MAHMIAVAAILIGATPAPIFDRLARAERFVIEAASPGAQLIAQPELFNLGYTYSDDNYHRAETLNGLTAGNRRVAFISLKGHTSNKGWRTRYVNTYCPRPSPLFEYPTRFSLAEQSSFL